VLLEREHHGWAVPAKPLEVQAFNELGQRFLPGLLIVVGKLAELARVHPELPCHLQLCG
jgi:hypothetical protein